MNHYYELDTANFSFPNGAGYMDYEDVGSIIADNTSKEYVSGCCDDKVYYVPLDNISRCLKCLETCELIEVK